VVHQNDNGGAGIRSAGSFPEPVPGGFFYLCMSKNTDGFFLLRDQNGLENPAMEKGNGYCSSTF